MLSDQSFDHFYANVSCKSEGLLGEPTLPRKQGGWTGGLEVGASAPTYPQTIMRLLILSSVLSIRKASDATSRWRPSWLKLLMVTTMRQILSFLKHHSAKMLVQGHHLGMPLSILEVTLKRRYHVLMKSSRWCQSFQNQKRSYTVILFRSPNYLHAYCKSWN